MFTRVGKHNFNKIMTIPEAKFNTYYAKKDISPDKIEEQKKRHCIHDGSIDIFPGFDFGRTRKQLQDLQETLKPFNIVLKHLKGCCFTNDKGTIVKKFIAYDDTETIIWYIYNSISPGSGQNKIIIGDYKQNLTLWMSATLNIRKDIIGKYTDLQLNSLNDNDELSDED
jgi:hypothetical protein